MTHLEPFRHRTMDGRHVRWWYSTPAGGLRGPFLNRGEAQRSVERWGGPAFAEADDANARGQLGADLESLLRDREARRDALAPDELDLFNPNRRLARDLFNPET